MRRYLLEAGQVFGEIIHFNAEQTHHICRVCRFGLGDRIQILIPPKQSFIVEIVSVAKDTAQGRIQESVSVPELPRPHLHLCLSIPKFSKVDWIVEKMVELGVSSITLFKSEYSFAHDIPPPKFLRWQKIAASALQQSGRIEPIVFEPAMPLALLLKTINQKVKPACLVCDEGTSVPLAKTVDDIAKQNPLDLYFFVGSEGGFSAQDLQLFQGFQVPQVSLGAQILRVETACVALASILRYSLS